MSDFDAILDECTERIASGETVAACIARYPQYAADLEPSLVAAEALSRLSAYSMTEPARTQAQARMRRELVAAGAAQAHGAGWWGQGWLRGLAGMAAILFLVMLLGANVAASQPGDWGYPLRAVVERAPARFAPDADGRVRAELRAAERRLADLDHHVGRGVSSDALASLLAADEAAFEAALTLPGPERAAVAAQLRAHAETLERLATRAGGEQGDGEAFRLAAQRAQAFAGQLQLGPRPDTSPGPSPTETPRHTSTVRPTLTTTMRPATRTPLASPERARPTEMQVTPRATVAPRATHTPEPQKPTLTPQGPRATSTIEASRRTRTPEPAATPGEGGPGPGGGENGEPGDNGGGGDHDGDGGGGGNSGAGGGQ